MILQNTYRLLLGTALSCALAACDGDFFNPTLTLDPPPFDKVLVVYAEGRAGDSTITLTVGENFGILDSKKVPLVSQPTIALEIDGTPQGSVTLENGVYTIRLPQTLAPGQVCRLSVSHPGFTTAVATQTMPQPVPLTAFTFIEEGGLDPNGNSSSRIQVRLSDPVDENFYAASLAWIYDSFAYEAFPSTNEPNAVYMYADESLTFTDQAFNGQVKELSLFTNQQGFINEDVELYLYWRSVPRDYYRYAATQDLFYQSVDNPFATPVEVHSGVQNGLGIFNLYTETAYRVR